MRIILRFYGLDDMKLLVFILSLQFLLLATTAQAEKIFRWQDAAGTWHYSEKPPINEAVEAINIKAPATSGSTKQPQVTSDTDDKVVANTVPTKSAEVAAEDKALADKNCQNAKANLKSLTEHGRLRILDEELGEERYLSEKEHSDWLQKSRDEVDKYCRQ